MSTICILHIDHTATSSVIRATRSRAHSRLFSTNFLPCFLWLLLLWFDVKKKRKPCSGPLYGLLRWSPMANIKEFLLGPLCIASCIYADETQPWNGSDIDRSPKSSVLLLCCCYDVVDIFFLFEPDYSSMLLYIVVSFAIHFVYTDGRQLLANWVRKGKNSSPTRRVAWFSFRRSGHYIKACSI